MVLFSEMVQFVLVLSKINKVFLLSKYINRISWTRSRYENL